MTGPRYPASMDAHAPCRSLAAYLADLCEQLRLLPLTSPARGPLISRIRQVEAEIDARGRL